MLTKHKQTKIYTVTTVPDAQKDYTNRMRNYSIIMGLRFVCIALALATPLPWSILPIAFAVLSPWFAVVIANNKKVDTPTVEKPTLQLK